MKYCWLFTLIKFYFSLSQLNAPCAAAQVSCCCCCCYHLARVYTTVMLLPATSSQSDRKTKRLTRFRVARKKWTQSNISEAAQSVCVSQGSLTIDSVFGYSPLLGMLAGFAWSVAAAAHLYSLHSLRRTIGSCIHTHTQTHARMLQSERQANTQNYNQILVKPNKKSPKGCLEMVSTTIHQNLNTDTKFSAVERPVENCTQPKWTLPFF